MSNPEPSQLDEIFKHFSVYISIFTKPVSFSILNFRGVLNVVSFILGVPRRLNFMCRRIGTNLTTIIGRKNNGNDCWGVYTGRGSAQKIAGYSL
jgi:hypothetical protein